MADDDSLDDGRLGSESWRARFFHDLRNVVRQETRDVAEGQTRTIIDELHDLRTSRVADTAEALHRALDIKPEDEPVLVEVVHGAIKSRRTRQASWSFVRSVASSSVKESLSHAIAVGAGIVLAYFLAKNWGAWPTWLMHG